VSDKTEKDSSKGAFEYDLKNKVSKQDALELLDTLIGFFWEAAEEIKKEKVKIILDKFKSFEETFIQEHTKRELIEKYRKCIAHKANSKNVTKNDWMRELISNEEANLCPIYMTPPTRLTRVEVSASILDFWIEDILKSNTNNNDINRATKNDFLLKGNKSLEPKSPHKKSINSSIVSKKAPKLIKKISLPTIDLIKVAEDKLSWSKILSQIPKDDKGRVVSLPEDKEDIVTQIEELLTKDKPLGMAFDQCRQDRGNEQLVIKVNSSDQPDPDQNDIWFLGDIHGDLLGMTAALSYVDQISKESGKKPIIIYLGDFFDRGEYGHWVLIKLFSQILGEDCSRVGMVAGNHDVELSHSRKKGFYSDVKPCEFADWLNEQSEDSVWPRLGRAAIEFFKRMPRAIFMPDGLLIAHGGVPHTDLPVKSFEQLNESPYLQDFVWTRAHERAIKRIPNRTSKGCSFGVKDFNQFCKQATKHALGDHPVRRMLRGHDHYLEGYKIFTKYVQYPLLTLNTRCYQPDMMKGPYSKSLCVARWVKGKMPEVHMLSIPRKHLVTYYPNRNV
jgi:hypothetical protein